MAKIIWSPDAISDLEHISKYISLDSEEYAALLVSRIFKTVETIELFPSSGRIVPEFEKEKVREILYKSYRIIYRIIDSSNEINILRIFHQSQQLNINLDET